MLKNLIKVSAVAAFAFAFVVVPVASAATGTVWTEYPFTSAEITNWTADRTLPTGGVNSVMYGNRNDVLSLGIDSAKQNAVQFYKTEGVKRNVNGATSLRADLYVESKWETDNTQVRAGMWGVGNETDTKIAAYPIAEYTVTDAFTGWRFYNVKSGTWFNSNAKVNTNAWNKVEIVLNANGSFTYRVNGKTVHTSPATSSVKFSSVILNSYNYGGDNDDYFVHWSNFATGQNVLNNKNQCQDGNWEAFMNEDDQVFSNQGLCVAYVQVKF